MKKELMQIPYVRDSACSQRQDPTDGILTTAASKMLYNYEPIFDEAAHEKRTKTWAL